MSSKLVLEAIVQSYERLNLVFHCEWARPQDGPNNEPVGRRALSGWVGVLMGVWYVNGWVGPWWLKVSFSIFDFEIYNKQDAFIPNIDSKIV